MSDFKVSYGCGDYPTNECSSSTPKRKSIWNEKDKKRMKAKGYHQDSTGCWFHPKHPSVFGEDV